MYLELVFFSLNIIFQFCSFFAFYVLPQTPSDLALSKDKRETAKMLAEYLKVMGCVA